MDYDENKVDDAVLELEGLLFVDDGFVVPVVVVLSPPAAQARPTTSVLTSSVEVDRSGHLRSRYSSNEDLPPLVTMSSLPTSDVYRGSAPVSSQDGFARVISMNFSKISAGIVTPEL
jgi:hypothetical protein